MAKKRAVSKNSRAARRATSPSIDTDKSLKDVQPPSRRAERPNVLAVQRSAGVTKKASKRKTQMSAKARRRYERGLQMAEAVEERTRNKMQKAEGRGKVVNARRREWKQINKEAGDDMEKEDEKAEMAAGMEENGWETDETDAAVDGEDRTQEEPLAPAVGTLDSDMDEIL